MRPQQSRFERIAVAVQSNATKLSSDELTEGIVMEAIGPPHFDNREIIEYLDGSVTDYSYFEPYRRYSQ
jgi:hypothetical protein